jgi:hypothetical protein
MPYNGGLNSCYKTLLCSTFPELCNYRLNLLGQKEINLQEANNAFCHFILSSCSLQLKYVLSGAIHCLISFIATYILCKDFYSLAPIFMVSTKCSDPRVLEFVVSNITCNNQWENCISLDFYFLGLSGP